MTKIEVNDKILEISVEITSLKNDRNYSVYAYENWGFIEVGLSPSEILEKEGFLFMSLWGIIRINLIESIWDDFSFELGLQDRYPKDSYKSESLYNLDGPKTFVLSRNDFYPNIKENKFFKGGSLSFDISNTGFQSIKDEYIWIYHDLFLPKLKETLDIKFLDSTINDKVEMIDGTDSDFFLNVHGLIFRRIILAKLSGNPLYNDICDYHRSKMPVIVEMAETYNMPHLKKFFLVLDTVIERLKNVKPLDDTRLTLNLS